VQRGWPHHGFCPICGRPVDLDGRPTSTPRLDVAAAQCSGRCAIALDVLVALRQLERDSAGIDERVDAYLAGEARAVLSDLLLARWRRGTWTPEPAHVLAELGVGPDFAAFTRPARGHAVAA
jgi:hypothetical protein